VRRKRSAHVKRTVHTVGRRKERGGGGLICPLIPPPHSVAHGSATVSCVEPLRAPWALRRAFYTSSSRCCSCSWRPRNDRTLLTPFPHFCSPLSPYIPPLLFPLFSITKSSLTQKVTTPNTHYTHTFFRKDMREEATGHAAADQHRPREPRVSRCPAGTSCPGGAGLSRRRHRPRPLRSRAARRRDRWS
jgi:hypothetical protein